MIFRVRILRERNTIFLEIITSDHSILTMDHPKFIISNQKEESINAKWVNMRTLRINAIT